MRRFLLLVLVAGCRPQASTVGVARSAQTQVEASSIQGTDGPTGDAGPAGVLDPSTSISRSSTGEELIAPASVDAQGDVTVAGRVRTLSAGTPKIYRQVIGPSTFKAYRGVNADEWAAFQGSAADGATSALCSARGGGYTTEYMTSEVPLPEGATPKKLVCTFIDETPAAAPVITARLRQRHISTATPASLGATCLSVSTSSSVVAADFQTVLGLPVDPALCPMTRGADEDGGNTAAGDNLSYALVLQAPPYTNGSGPSDIRPDKLCLVSCIVHYTLDSL